jgi:hypothetical protein
LVEDLQTKAPLDWAELQKKVPNVVRLGYHEDATSALSQWHIPLAHYLESWGDALTAGGDYLSMQPMILPLFGGLSEIELINMLLGGPKLQGPELIQETFRLTNPRAIFKQCGRAFCTTVLLRTFKALISKRIQRRRSRNSAPRFRVASAPPTPESPEIV